MWSNSELSISSNIPGVCVGVRVGWVGEIESYIAQNATQKQAKLKDARK